MRWPRPSKSISTFNGDVTDTSKPFNSDSRNCETRLSGLLLIVTCLSVIVKLDMKPSVSSHGGCDGVKIVVVVPTFVVVPKLVVVPTLVVVPKLVVVPTLVVVPSVVVSSGVVVIIVSFVIIGVGRSDT